jgi:hypothetical protein
MKYRLFRARRDALHAVTDRPRMRRGLLAFSLMALCTAAWTSGSESLQLAAKTAAPSAKRKAAAPKAAPANAPDSVAAANPDSATDSSQSSAPSEGSAQAASPIQADSAAVNPAAPAGLVLDYVALERRAQEVHPILKEKHLDIDKAEQQLRELEMAAILPRFQVETGVGPAPGL